MQAPGRARRALAHWYGDSVKNGELADAQLIASELVTNAFMHGTGQIRLKAHLDKDRLMVQVMDEGSGFEYTPQELPVRAVHGRGLVVVEELASRWGINQGSTLVWAEIRRSD